MINFNNFAIPAHLQQAVAPTTNTTEGTTPVAEEVTTVAVVTEETTPAVATNTVVTSADVQTSPSTNVGEDNITVNVEDSADIKIENVINSYENNNSQIEVKTDINANINGNENVNFDKSVEVKEDAEVVVVTNVEVDSANTPSHFNLAPVDSTKQEATSLSIDALFSTLSDEAAQADAAQATSEKKALKDGVTTVTPAEAAKSKADALKKNEDDFSGINADTIIRIGRDQLPITQFFTLEEIENGIPKKSKKDAESVSYIKIDGELVRQRLEKAGYVEFVKGFTKMAFFGENRNFILPLPIAKVKGNISTTSLLESTEKRIPYFLYKAFLALATYYGKLGYETRGEFYYDYEAEEFVLYIPEQLAHPMWVKKTEAEEKFVTDMLKKKNRVFDLVCEIHSHHQMKPYPSQLDNESERLPKMTYVIVGETHLENPSMTARVFQTNGTYRQLTADDIFEHVDLPSAAEFSNYVIVDFNIKLAK